MKAVLCGIVDHGFFAPTTVAGRVIASATPGNIMPGVAGALLTVGSVIVSPQETAELILHAYDIMKEQDLSMGCVLTEMGFLPKEMPGIAAISFMPGIIAHAVEESMGIKLRVVEGQYTGRAEKSLPLDYRR